MGGREGGREGRWAGGRETFSAPSLAFRHHTTHSVCKECVQAGVCACARARARERERERERERGGRVGRGAGGRESKRGREGRRESTRGVPGATVRAWHPVQNRHHLSECPKRRSFAVERILRLLGGISSTHEHPKNARRPHLLLMLLVLHPLPHFSSLPPTPCLRPTHTNARAHTCTRTYSCDTIV